MVELFGHSHLAYPTFKALESQYLRIFTSSFWGVYVLFAFKGFLWQLHACIHIKFDSFYFYSLALLHTPWMYILECLWCAIRNITNLEPHVFCLAILGLTNRSVFLWMEIAIWANILETKSRHCVSKAACLYACWVY